NWSPTEHRNSTNFVIPRHNKESSINKVSSNCYDFIMRPEIATKDLIEQVPTDFIDARLFIVPGNDEIRAIPMLRSTESIQKALLSRFKEFGVGLDFVIFDTQPSPTSLHSAIASITDYVLVPFQCEGFSVVDMDSAVANMNEVNEMSRAVGLNKAKVLGLIPNMYRGKTVLHREALKDVKAKFGDLVWSPIPQAVAISTHQYMSESVVDYTTDERLVEILQRFIDRVHDNIFEVSI
ncbi:MAG: ParA family protein, partial [Bacteroidota bacterium]